MSTSSSQLFFGALSGPPGKLSDAGISAPAESVSEPSLFGRICLRFRTDEELALRLQGGDADALAVLFARHSGLVFSVACRILRNGAEAEDAAQQVFIDIFRSIRQFDPKRGSFRTWLLVFAYQRTLNRRRALTASRFFVTDSLDESLPGISRPKGGQPCFSAGEADILLRQLLATLEPRQRRTIELIHYEGLTAAEVSVRTGETVRVVRHNLYRGLEKLRRQLSSQPASLGAAGGADE